MRSAFSRGRSLSPSMLWLLTAVAGGAALFLVNAGDQAATAATTAQQRKQINDFNAAVRKAAKLVDSGKSREAQAAAIELQEAIVKLVGDKPDPDVVKLLDPVLKQLTEIRPILDLDGLKVPALPDFSPPPMDTAKPKTPGKPAEKPKPANGEVSFSAEIAPILVGKCGRCHVNDTKGMVSMSTFAALMKGSVKDGAIILPGKGTGSRIVEVIESGDMPRGGAKVTAEELAVLVKWIDQGAKNDGADDNVGLRSLATMANAAPPVTVEKATGKESVKFAIDVAPTIVAQCTGCHGARQPAGQLSLLTFAALLRGGDSGPPLVPGNPAESLLIKKIKGLAGDRMPLRRDPLTPEVIAKFETWVQEGAKFDGDSDTLPLVRVAAVAKARMQTPVELSKDRVGFAAQNWRLAIPDDKAVSIETKNFLLMGNVGEETLKEISEVAEAQVAKVATALKISAGAPLIKGRLSVYVMANRYDYTEFATMIEERSLPKEWRGHWKYDIVDPYIVLVKPTPNDDFTIESLLAQQIASIYVAGKSDGAGPRWFSEGVGRALAAKLNATDGRVVRWDSQIAEVLSRMSKPDDFMSGKLPPEDSDVLSYSFVKLLMSKSKNFGTLLTAFNRGQPLDQALAAAYGGATAQLAAGWAPWAAKGGK